MMPVYNMSVAGAVVLIVAPSSGSFDRAVFDKVFVPGGEYGLDVETTALHESLDQHYGGFSVRLVQFATETEAWVLDVSDPVQRGAASSLLANVTTTFVSHTAMDVVSVHREFGIDISDRNTDTHVLGGIVHPDRAGAGGLDLKSLAKEHVGPELEQAQDSLHQRFNELWTGKSGAKQSDVHNHGWAAIPANDPAYLVYAGLDALFAKRLARVLRDATETPKEVIALDCWLAGRLAARQARGLCVSRDEVERLRDDCEAAVETPTKALEELTGGLRPTQAVKLSEWLIERGVSGKMSKTGSSLSLSKSDLPTLLDGDLSSEAKKAIENLIAVREQQDALTKSKGLLSRLDEDSRLHPSIKAIGAPTMRMSSSGFNMQAVSKSNHRQRGVFHPEAGHVFLGADFDQIELRLVAALAGEQAMYDTVLSGGDLHQLTADRIGVPRDIAKAVNFMIVYGGGGQAVATKTGLPVAECKRHVERFKQSYPAIARLADECGRRPTITTITGRKLLPPTGKNGPRTYANVNYLIQSSARDLLVMAWRAFASEHPDSVWLSIHDELILEVPETEVEAYSAAVESAMNFTLRGMPFAAAAVPLIDEHGISRWMSTDRAEAIRGGHDDD